MSKMLLEAYLTTREDVFDRRDRKWHVRLPTVGSFADYLGIHRDTLYQWAKRDQAWEYALERIKRIQYVRLLNGGLSGRYQAWLVMRLLKSNHAHRLRPLKRV